MAPKLATTGHLEAKPVVINAIHDPRSACRAVLAPGTRIRLAAPEFRTTVIGVVRASDERTIALSIPDQAGGPSVNWEQVARLEVSRGRATRQSGAVIDLLNGAAAGALVGRATYRPRPLHFESESMAGGAIPAGLVGAGIGAVVPTAERWQDVPHGRPRIGVVPRPNGASGSSLGAAF